MIFELNETGLFIDGKQCDGTDLDNLMRELHILRANIEPPVPDEMATGQKVIVQHDPITEMSYDIDDRIMLSLQHLALGWCVFTFTKADLSSLIDGATAMIATKADNFIAGDNKIKH